MYGRDHIPLSNSTVLGPKGEGDEVDLICEASGGKPIPKVKWYNGTTEIQRGRYFQIKQKRLNQPHLIEKYLYAKINNFTKER